MNYDFHLTEEIANPVEPVNGKLNGFRLPLTAPPGFAVGQPRSDSLKLRHSPQHRERWSFQSKIRPVAQISPSGSFAPLVNLVGVATPNPPLTGAERRYCGAAAPKNFINLPSPGDCIFANSPDFLMPSCISAIFLACCSFSSYIEDRQGRTSRTDHAKNFPRNFLKRLRWIPCFFLFVEVQLF